VTFERIDPVYIIDLADATHPVIAGELEIPGFSTYLHPISDDLLLGIGKDVINSGRTSIFQGMNMRLFDISDPANIAVKSDIKIGKRGTESHVLYDSHAFTIVPGTADTPHRIALPVSVTGLHQVTLDEQPFHIYNWSEHALYLFEIDDSGQDVRIESAGKLVSEDLSTGRVRQPMCCNWNDRSFTDGEVVHYLHNNRLYSAAWENSQSADNLFIPTLFKDAVPDACTAEVRDGLRVHVQDQDTNQYLSCPTVSAVEGDFSQQLNTGCADLTSGLAEREGSYEISVAMDGYLPWQRSDVRVQADECHVGSTSLQVYLQKE
jgi:hypothetical protein